MWVLVEIQSSAFLMPVPHAKSAENTLISVKNQDFHGRIKL
jgi:hypothetical protein